MEFLPLSDWNIFDSNEPVVIAGPCSAESEEQVLNTAEALNKIGINVFRAGIWKPRTHPGCFEGVGTIGLSWLKKVREVYGIKVCTEVACREHIEESLSAGIDMLWIGARTSANPFLVQEIADTLKGIDIPVLIKNPINPDLDLWIGAIERLNNAGIRKIGVIHRGFSTNKKIKYRNEPLWNIPIELKTRFPELPIFSDPSHIAGDTLYLSELSQRAMDLGFDGLMIESHNDPSCAMSDAKQQLKPSQLHDLLNHIKVREKDSDSLGYKESIEQLREEIDLIDENLLSFLSSRMEISRKIGEYKKHHNIAILQTTRWDKLLSDMIEKGKGYGLSKEFILNLFRLIHEESIRCQNEILSDSSSE